MERAHPTPLYFKRPDVGRGRWAVAAVMGTGLGVGMIFLSYLVPAIVLGSVEGATYGLVGILQMTLVPIAVWIGLRPVGLSLSDIGLRGPRIGADAALGLSVALVFAIIQFGFLIPATGGAARSDVAANAAQLGDSLAGVIGFIILAWTGGIAEELLFRGHLLTMLRNAFGPSRTALALAAILTIVVFGALHGYQGWAGVIDTGLYGGVILTALFVYTDGRLTACAVAHAAWNTLAVIGLYIWY